MMPKQQGVDVGIFFGRPERSQILAEKLRVLGFSVTLYNREGQPGTYCSVPCTLPQAFFRLLSTRHDIYLTSLSFIPSLCLYLNKLSRGIPYVYNAVGLHSATYRDRSARWPCPRLAERWLYPALMDRVFAGASRIVCNSRYLEGRLQREFPRYAHKILTIYNGIDFERFTSGRRVSIDGIPAEAPKLVTVMTWNYEGKSAAAKVIVEAMGIITRRYPEARLIIAAKCSHRTYAKEMESFVAAKPWKDSVKILFNLSNVPDLLASADLFVYATPNESNDSLPRALLEAQAAGLPAVSTATAGCPEIVKNSRTGMLVPYDVETLAARVIDLLSDPSKRREFGKQSRDHIRERFSWDHMAEAYAELFLKVVPE